MIRKIKTYLRSGCLKPLNVTDQRKISNLLVELQADKKQHQGSGF